MTNNLDKIFNLVGFYKQRFADLADGTKLLQIDDWSKITPKRLEKYICDGHIVDWIDGYDVGPSPLTDALIQEVSPEIIAILIAAGANVNAPTVLANGKKVTPLKIVRSQVPTHENMQKELMLLRAGANDDIVAWLRKHKTELPQLDWMFGRGKCLRKSLRFIGYKEGAKVFQCGHSYTYIKEKAGEIWNEDDFDIYDKGLRLNHFSGPEPEWLNNELGNKFAKEFFAKCERLSFDVAMHQYYTYLGSIYFFAGNKKRCERISSAADDIRKHFSYNNWNELIADTHNITAAAEYSKMKKKQFPAMYEWFHMDD